MEGSQACFGLDGGGVLALPWRWRSARWRSPITASGSASDLRSLLGSLSIPVLAGLHRRRFDIALLIAVFLPLKSHAREARASPSPRRLPFIIRLIGDRLLWMDERLP